LRSKRTDSFSVQLVDWMMPPSNWFTTPSGLTICPASTAATTRVTRTAPVFGSTVTSATSAT
jgi:hypothetical protein